MTTHNEGQAMGSNSGQGEGGHTPGPWRSFQQADGTRYLVVAGDGSRPNELVVAHVSGYTATMHAAEAANAHLIAAAPSLLAACKAALNILVVAASEDAPNTIGEVRAAIALAEGRA